MKKYTRALLLMGCCLIIVQTSVLAQEDSSSLYNRILHFPDRLFSKVNHKSADISRRLEKQTDRYLNSLAKQERKLKKQLASKDSLAASRIFDDALAQYSSLQTRLSLLPAKALKLRGTYIPHLDSLQTTVGFLNKAQGLLKQGPEAQARLKQAAGSMDRLQVKFTQAEEVKSFIRQRQQFLKEHLDRYGMGKQLKSFHKQVYYYQAQVDEYKQLFSNPSRMEAKAIGLLKQSAQFKSFFDRNSQLAGMFRLPGNSDGAGTATLVSLAGMQTRESVTHDLVQRFGSESKMQETMSKQFQSAKGGLDQLKDKIANVGGGSSDIPMPDFKPNNQKTKSFLSRLELGSTLQSVKANRFFPSSTDIGLSLNYKLNERSTVGVGGSYRVGWGKSIRHASITHQGVGVRSFVDYKLKGSIWLSGGAEMNYRSQFSSFDVLRNYSAWQKSALLGLSKKYQVSSKLKGNVQLLYDFLWKQQVPHTQQFVFRLGYSLK